MTIQAYPDIIRGPAGPVIELPRRPGMTLAEIVAEVPLEHEALRPHLRAKLNGELLLDPSNYRVIRPKDGTSITVFVPLHDGKNAGTILAAIAAIALLGASLYIGAFGLPILGSLFAAGSTGASLLSSGLAIGASLLLQGLSAASVSTTAGTSASRDVGVAAAQNSFELGAYLQKVIGTRRVAPQMLMPPYTSFDSFDQYVFCAYGFAGPHKIEDVRIGSAAVADDLNVTMETREGFSGDAPISFLDKTVIEIPSSIVLTDFVTIASSEASTSLDTAQPVYLPQWHRLETRDSPYAAVLNFVFDNGLYNQYPSDDSDNQVAAVTALRLRMRVKGAAIWVNLPEFVVRGRRGVNALRIAIKLVWCARDDIPGVSAPAANWQGISWLYSAVPDPMTEWFADAYFAGAVVDAEDAQHVTLYLDEAAFPKGRYEIEMMRGQTVHNAIWDPATHKLGSGGTTLTSFFSYITNVGTLDLIEAPNNYAHELALNSVQSIFNEAPFDFSRQPTSVIALKVKNKSVDQVNCLASGYTQDWDGAAWSGPVVSRNPASWYREVLGGSQNAEPLDASLIGSAGLVDWSTWCVHEQIEVNAVLQNQTVTEVLALIAQAGFARPRYGASNGVVIDRRRGKKGLITQRNAASFAFTKPFTRLPHALRVTFADEDNEYEVGELTVYDDGYNADGSGGLIEATRFDSVTYQGLTRTDLVEARARRDMRFGRYRSRLVSFTMDIEHLEHDIGTRVLVETDILGTIGGRGRIRSILTAGGNITGIVLDEDAIFPSAGDGGGALLTEGGDTLVTEGGDRLVTEDADGGPPRAVSIRLRDGDLLTRQIETDDGDLTTLMFSAPFAMPTDTDASALIVPGAVVATGLLGAEARDMLLWDIAPAPGLTAQVTALDYAETAIYGGSDFNNDFSSDFGCAL